MNMTLLMAAKRRVIPLTGTRVTVSLDRSNTGEPVFNYSVELQGPLDDMQRKLLLLAVENCPMRATLSKPQKFKLGNK